MCGRYALYQSAEALGRHYNLATIPPSLDSSYNVAPGQIMPVIIESNDGKRHLESMKWGLIPFWAQDPAIGYRMINARCESIFEKPAWRSVILHKRCLIPANGFYEWRKPPTGSKGHNQPFYIKPKQMELFSFAGVWEAWKDHADNEWKTYSIITTVANKEMSGVHDRMPLILKPEDEASWLEPSKVTRSSLKPLLRPFEDNGLEMYQVSEDVNNPRHNDSHLIKAVE